MNANINSLPLIAAGIVLFNPDLHRLADNLLSVIGQTDSVILVDNGSDNIEQIQSFIYSLTDCRHVDLISNKENLGIAEALNQICRWAEANAYQWVLTLDQDSVCSESMVAEMMKYTKDERVGMVCPSIVDLNIRDYCPSSEGVSAVDFCITSGTLLRITSWKAVGGFWSDLFIDMVDADMSWSICEKGLSILKVHSALLNHEIGKACMVPFRGGYTADFNHSALRDYYIIRNTLAVCRKHGKRLLGLKWNLKKFYLVNRFESDRTSKNRMMLLGLVDGLLGHYGKCRYKI